MKVLLNCISRADKTIKAIWTNRFHSSLKSLKIKYSLLIHWPPHPDSGTNKPVSNSIATWCSRNLPPEQAQTIKINNR